MHPITFIHAADLHLDSPFQHTKGLDGSWKELLKESTWQALDNLIELALKESVDFVIIAGDIFDKESYSVKAKVRFINKMKRLTDAKIHIYIIHGNHDPLTEDPTRNFIDIGGHPYVHIFPSDETISISHYKLGQEVARLYGRSYWQRQVTKDLASECIAKQQQELQQVPQDKPQEEILKIAILHGQSGLDTDAQPYAPFTLEKLKQSNIDYWALGHIHKPTILNNQHPYIVYSGNVQGRHSGEIGERGCYLVKCIDQQQVELNFHALDAVRWQELEVLVETNNEDEDSNEDNEENKYNNYNDNEYKDNAISIIVDNIKNQLSRNIKDEDKHHIIKLNLKGQTPYYTALRQQGVLEYIAEELSLEKLLIISIVNKTLPIVNIGNLRQQDTLLGEFLSLIEELRTNPQVFKELRKELDELYGLPTFQQITKTNAGQLGKEQWNLIKLEKDWTMWLDEVEQLGLDLLLDIIDRNGNSACVVGVEMSENQEN
ncbi:metallophosphoesterase family protein [Desulfuribacillus alkaliarsenatis]|uniref:Calcineurin-like phosphoesterase domain-containing protein n=1 Tax=Desulfuribacillus alkaliarsenatis TaxID=766136 RepID=A0A1E5G1L5_9FIRM|nr:DNA repair exonuclease [Desulfuribacillus alkaliarsenatis]OEF96726.1 hypothetical protein BHF68_06535 [Desulfuribacillus alkaliarsenatis]